MYSSGDFNIYPNPSHGELFVAYGGNEIKSEVPLQGQSQLQIKKPSVLVFKVNVFDKSEKLVISGESKDNKVHLDTRDLKPGHYFLHIYAGDHVFREQIIIEN